MVVSVLLHHPASAQLDGNCCTAAFQPNQGLIGHAPAADMAGLELLDAMAGTAILALLDHPGMSNLFQAVPGQARLVRAGPQPVAHVAGALILAHTTHLPHNLGSSDVLHNARRVCQRAGISRRCLGARQIQATRAFWLQVFGCEHTREMAFNTSYGQAGCYCLKSVDRNRVWVAVLHHAHVKKPTPTTHFVSTASL